ncbi:hypothetical protein [Halomonas sp. DQ26W]|uniref:hypothetical protein n=1 Tax=Halomonas sp. DQ26W TaxID=2282311 RepID=UPI0015F02392|nr:hypothetical protein [Halomonas sp. DQ26W]
MEARWVNLYQTIEHNRAVMAAKEAGRGLSILRETGMHQPFSQHLLSALATA